MALVLSELVLFSFPTSYLFDITQLVSTSNKKSSSGEMKKDQKRVGIYRGNGLDTCLGQR